MQTLAKYNIDGNFNEYSKGIMMFTNLPPIILCYPVFVRKKKMVITNGNV